MPAKMLMNWEKKNKLWRQQHNRKRYVVSCRQLSKWTGKPVPSTEEGSYQVANAWWETKVAEIDGQKPPHPHQAEIDELIRRRDWARAHGDGSQAEYHDANARFLTDNPDVTSPMAGDREIRREVFKREYGHEPDDALLHVLTGDVVWDDRLHREATPAVPDDLTVKGQVKRYLDMEITRVNAGDLKPNEFDTIQRCLYRFRDFIGGELPISVIDGTKFETWWNSVYALDISSDYKKKMFRLSKKLIESAVGKDLMAAPKNLHEKRFTFKTTTKAVPTVSLAEVRMLIDNVDKAPAQMELLLLLMLNCGMTQVDCSSLLQTEVDWTEGRIIRRRTKTLQESNPPIVDYKLWPRTFELLKLHRQPKGDLVLLNSYGRPWVEQKLTGDKGKKRDGFHSIFVTYAKEIGFTKPPKILRKASATLLHSNPTYARYVLHFLGQSPQTVAEKSYVSPSRQQFDKAVLWLGKQYGFVQ